MESVKERQSDMEDRIKIHPIGVPGEKGRSNIWRESGWEFLQLLKEQDSSDSGIKVNPKQIYTKSPRDEVSEHERRGDWKPPERKDPL